MRIFFNQAGYITNRPKVAFANEGDSFAIVSDETGETVFQKNTKDCGYDKLSGYNLKILDFSEFEGEGLFYLKVGGVKTLSFSISAKPYSDIKKAIMKNFYYQRCGLTLLESYANAHVHAACHTKKALVLNKSGKSPNNRGADVSGGWHDAGDYGRYTVSAATALGHLLYAYELFPEKLGDKLEIPPGMYKVPDFLTECRYELEWLLKMQTRDLNDKGGFHHKVTTKVHCGMIMPEKDEENLYLFPVSSTATAYACAVLLLAVRVFRKFDSKFTRKLRDSAELAWRWLSANDFEYFSNPPETATNEYFTYNDIDGRYWAAVEMYRFTREEKYLDYIRTLLTSVDPVGFGWEKAGGFGSLSYLLHVKFNTRDRLGGKLAEFFTEEADRLVEKAQSNAFGVTLETGDFKEFSNMTVICNAMVLLTAFHVCEDQRRSIDYENTALGQLHYLLGRNATGYCFVSGCGAKSVNFPHHRISTADGIKQCIPGIVSCGPNAYFEDECIKEALKPDTPPACCFLDDYRSHSTNANALFLNSCAVFLTGYFD